MISDHVMPLSLVELIIEGARLIAKKDDIVRNANIAAMGNERYFTLDYSRIETMRKLQDYIERGTEEQVKAFIDGIRTCRGQK